MQKHTGFLYELRPTDYITGATPLSAVVVKTDGDWTSYLPTGEKQYKYATFDTMSCATFSFLNAIETSVNYFVATKKLTDDQITQLRLLGFYADGKFNCSDRFTAIMSGTMPNGNYFQNVGDSIRRDGLLPEVLLPFGGNSQAEYLDKNLITDILKENAKKILDIFDISYQWIVGDIQEVLKQCPVQGAINGGTHAVMIPVENKYFDSYEPYLKELTPLQYAMKVIVTVKEQKKEWKYFKATESTGSNGHTVSELKTELVDLLDIIREECGFALKLVSGYRTVAENAKLPDSAEKSAHTTREAGDVYVVDSRKRQILIDVARKHGINRIGIGKTFVHLDISKTLPQNVTWTYYN